MECSTSRTREWPVDSPVPPIVVNLYMEYFEERAIREAPHPPPLIHMVEIHGWYIHRASRE